jgi:hypothetical protein
MEMDVLLAQVPNLKEEAQRQRKQGTEAIGRADRLDRVIRDIEALAGLRNDPPTILGEQDDLSDDSPDIHLTGIAAVREVMREAIGRPLRASEIHAVLEKRGWVSSSNQAPNRSTEVALHRMARRGEVERLDRGIFLMREKAPPDDEN